MRLTYLDTYTGQINNTSVLVQRSHMQPHTGLPCWQGLQQAEIELCAPQ